ncbi:MAG: GIY-YIG nuclease family protein [Scytolyngbya sp. HA4215-MV1]|nr:GIY-YIG nuclease family protein [Scytolyngbya sp. HA4215-MV1]
MSMDWQPLDISNIPAESGVYGFKSGDRWLYIGRAKDLSKRLTRRHIPLQIALGLSGVTFHYQITDHPGRLEHRLIQELEPGWNGHTSKDCSDPYSACRSGVMSQVERDYLDSVGELL